MSPQATPSRAAAKRANPSRNGRAEHNGHAASLRGQRGEAVSARGARTRQRVAEALIGLLEEGDPAPTARAVAERAGVSVRLVFHHFEDMEALYTMVGRVQAERHWETVRPVDPDLPLEERIERTVQQRARLFETVGPVRRAGVALAARHAEIAEGVARSDALLRRWLEHTFAPELAAAGKGRRELLAALDVAASWETWDRLRNSQHLAAAAARRAVARMLGALLSGT